MKSLRALKVVSIALLALLAIQFELGMTVNLSPSLQNTPAFSFSLPAVWGALSKVGAAATTHAVVGSLLVILTLGAFLLALLTRLPSIVVFGVLGFLTAAVAAATGVLFTLSGFQADGLSHGMATNFLATFSFQFIELCIVSVQLARSRLSTPQA